MTSATTARKERVEDSYSKLTQYLDTGGRRQLKALVLRMASGSGKGDGAATMRRSLEDVADDIVSDAVLKAVHAWSRYDHSKPLHPWMTIIVRNLTITYMGKERTKGTLQLDGMTEQGEAGHARIIRGSGGVARLTTDIGEQQARFRAEADITGRFGRIGAASPVEGMSASEIEARCREIAGDEEYEKMLRLFCDPAVNSHTEAVRLGMTPQQVRLKARQTRRRIVEGFGKDA